MPKTNEQIIKDILIHANNIAGLDEKAQREVIKLLNQIEEQLIADVAKINPSAPKFLIQRRNRLNKLIKQARLTIQTGNEDIQKYLLDNNKELAEQEILWNQNLLKESLPAEISVTAINTTRISDELLTELTKDVIIDGAPSKEWWDGQLTKGDNSLQSKFTKSMRAGVFAGESVDNLVKRIKNPNTIGYIGLETITRHNAEALVRTSVQTVINRAKEKVYEANAHLLKGLRWISTDDDRTTDICNDRDDKLYTATSPHTPIGHSFSWESGPGSIHWQCVIGSTKVQADDIELIFKRFYEGKVITINTSSGCVLTCTPNHPIFTVNGWVDAGKLKEGDKVIRDCSSKWIIGVDTDKNNMIPSIEDITGSLIKSGKMLSVPMPMTSKDFHTDGSDGEVHVIFPYSGLWIRLKTLFSKLIKNKVFIDRGFPALVKFISFSHFKKFIISFLNIPGSNVGVFSKLFSFLDRSIIHSGLLLFLSASKLNTILFKDSFNGSKADIEPVGNTFNTNTLIIKCQNFINRNLNKFKRRIVSGLLKNPTNRLLFDPDLSTNIINGHFGAVQLDNITSLNIADYSGHVYNLQTVNGFYTANYIITHNCRSTSAPILKSIEELKKQRKGEIII